MDSFVDTFITWIGSEVIPSMLSAKAWPFIKNDIWSALLATQLKTALPFSVMFTDSGALVISGEKTTAHS